MASPPRPPIVLRVSEYAPDMPDYMNGQSDNVFNVIPRTPTSYGPLNSPAVFSSALTARCQGAFFGLDSTSSVRGFSGDNHDLYQLTGSSSAIWAAVSKSAGGYNILAEDQWTFLLYGTRIIALNISDPAQSFLMGSSANFADLISTANPPKAAYGAVIKTFLMLGNTSDPIYGVQPQRCWWSRNGDPTKFDDPNSALAAQFETSFQDLLGGGGRIQGIVGGLGTADGAVFMEHAIYRIMFVGAPVVFDFYAAQGVRGCKAPGSIAQLGTTVYFFAEDGFYAFDGTNTRPIGANRVDSTFTSTVDQSALQFVSSAIDPVNKLYLVAYPTTGGGSTAMNMLIYNWQLDRWSTAIPLPSGFEIITRAISFGYTLDQLYTVLGYSLDTLPFTLDSRVWTDGNVLLGLFDTAHKLNFFTGTSLAAIVDTSENQPNPTGTTRIYNARPITDGGTPSVSIGVRNRQQDSVVFGTAVSMNAIGQSPQRARGRYMRARLTLPAGSVYKHISGVEVDGMPAGGRY